MKLLHVIPSLSPATGGTAEALRQLAAVSPEAGIETEIVCLDAPDSDWIGSFAVPVHALDWRGGKYGRSPQLREWLAGNVARFDGVVAHGIWTYPTLAAARACRGRVPYAVFTHGMLDPWFQRRYPLKHLKKRLYWPLQYPALRDAKAVLFTCRMESELAPRSFRPNQWASLVVPFGTNPPPQEEPAQRAAFQAALPQLAGRRFLLFLSRVHEKKGCDLLVEAFASVAEQEPDIDLIIAGPDQTGIQAGLMALAEKLGIGARIHWPGMLTGHAKWGALRACEAMVLPSHQENFGVVVAEALACGRPALISNQVNIWPEIKESGAGLVAADTLDGIRSLLTRWFARNGPERAAMSERALAAFAAQFSMRNCALALRDLFSR